jgi:hypothetical protein
MRTGIETANYQINKKLALAPALHFNEIKMKRGRRIGAVQKDRICGELSAA